LKIVMSELNPRNPSGTSFDLHLSRPMTDFEAAAAEKVLSKGFAAAVVTGPSIVTINDVSVEAIEQRKDILQQLVSEVEAHARQQQQAQDAAAAQAQAQIEDAGRRAAAIDWS
jgi:heme exporter protein D